MAFTAGFLSTGLSRDITEVTSHFGSAGSNVTIEAVTGLDTGDRCLRMQADTDGSNCLVPLLKTTINGVGGGLGLIVIPMFITFGGTLTNAFGIITNGTRTGNAGARQYARFNTDGSISFLDKNANVLTSYAAGLGVTGKHATIVYDFISVVRNAVAATYWVFIYLYIEQTLVMAFSTGLDQTEYFNTADYLYYGEYMAAGANAGQKIYLANGLARYSGTAGDALHLAAYPDQRAYGGGHYAPTSQGVTNTWGQTGDATPDKWKNLGATHDYPNDGATTIESSTVINDKDLFYLQQNSANDLPGGITIDDVVTKAVAVLTGGAKNSAYGLVRDPVGNEVTSTAILALTTSYVYDLVRYATAPAGGAWVLSDFDQLSGTASAVTHTTLTDNGTNSLGQFIGATVTMGGRTLVVTDVAGSVITGAAGWQGGADPAAGAYTVNVMKMQWGFKTFSAATVGVNVTAMAAPEVVYHTATLPLTPPPIIVMPASLLVPATLPTFEKTRMIAV